MNENPIIVALDFGSAAGARTLIRSLRGSVRFFKIGMELYASAGPDFVSELIDGGNQVFLDMKFYDIDETVRRAVAQVAKRGVRFLTVHGSQSVMRAAVEGRGDGGLELLGVTVLTSFDETDLRQLGYPCSVEDLVTLRVRNAVEAGMDGVVCSPVEVARMRKTAGPKMLLVTPGVRSAGSAAGDQKRIATPRDAIRNGADYLVIGRQVTRAPDPKAEIEAILEELSS
jgi:orotidine-5'-phosphate decarboxylase